MRLGVLTSVETRHRYFANRLADCCPVVFAGYESTGYSPAKLDAHDLTDHERAVVQAHFDERGRQETRFFGGHSAPLEPRPQRTVLTLAPGALNSTETLKAMFDAGVDTLAVFGTNLIREPLLTRFAGRIVNLHLGLSPYYRGTATNFYPLLNEEPEFVGATIHRIDAGIDSGPILRHARPDIVAGDRPHTIGCKAIEAGVNAMIRVLESLNRNEVDPVPQWPEPRARLYLRKDYHPRQVVELYDKWNSGLLERYLQRADRVRNQFRLIE